MDHDPTLDDFHRVDTAFAVEGLDMRSHKGRSVVRVAIDGKTHYLKRFWFLPAQLFKRQVARGLHEMRMIDWLNAGGFSGPIIVRRGTESVFGWRKRAFFLMEEAPDELPLDAAWRNEPERADELLTALAAFAARLHDAGFMHTDFSERHILVGRDASASQPEAAWTFRLIDVERASVGRGDECRAAADLATLAASVYDETLRERIKTVFLDEYLRSRNPAPAVDFRTLVMRAKPTKTF